MDASSPEIEDAAATPMIAQYLEMKRKAGDALLFYRMGDFYELFFDDAVKAAAALDITLTKRGRHLGEDIAMCGVPQHSHEAYLARLIRKGFDVAICEQIEDPAEARKRGSKAVVKRAIVRVVTPGTLTEDSLLEAGRSNHLAAIAALGGGREGAVAWADVSTGELQVRAAQAEDARLQLAALSLSELIVSDDAPEAWRAAAKEGAEKAKLAFQPGALFDSRSGERRLKEHFGVAALDAFGDFSRAELAALGALLAYIELTQIGRMPVLRAPQRAAAGAAMIIDPATRASLELVETQSGAREGSLLGAIDRTVTGPGLRLLAARVSAPLTEPGAIHRRLDAVAYLAGEARPLEALRERLRAMPDLARAVSRLSLGRGGPRDLAAVRDGLDAARGVAALLAGLSRTAPPPEEIARAAAALEAKDSGGFSALHRRLSEALSQTLPLAARDGGFIAAGFDPGLDSTRLLRDESRKVIAALEAEYRSAADVRTLRIKHNNVLGYFIETPPGQGDRLLDAALGGQFIHRQTLASAVRFTTPALAELDARIARARDEALARELALFETLAADVLGSARALVEAAEAAAALDVAAGFATLAREEGWRRPRIDESLAFTVEGGRHPAVEAALRRSGGGAFTPNDCRLGDGAQPALQLVTGPNMAGKSTYLRQNALIAILAQAGGFVPAASAHIGVVDRVFSRVGAADDLARGRSTFMVEMVETAAILHQASARSLVVLDEIGRGTSTFDGLSIPWSTHEHLHDRIGCRGLFATHYHELTALSSSLVRLENVSMRVREWKGNVVFLHEVTAGPADRSYGVAVARLAGLPASAVRRADEILARLEAGRRRDGLADLPLFAAGSSPPPPEPPPAAPAGAALAEAVRALDPDALSPREALESLYRLKSLADAL